MRTPLYSLAAVCALAVPAAAHAESISNGTGPPITVTDNQIASPYPAELKITGADGTTTKAEVFVNLSSDAPDDLELAIVSPSGDATLLMSDACGGTAFTNRTWLFSPPPATAMPDAGPCPTGGYLPSAYVPGESFPAPWPTGATTNLSNLLGSSPNGSWKLFARDDSAFGASSISSWGLVLQTGTGELVVPAGPATNGVSNPYPSTKTFATPAGQVIDDLNLKITEFNHEHPADVDMLLQGPSGDAVMAMSDACGLTDINTSADWTFDDEATLLFGDGTFANCDQTAIKPVDFGPAPEDMPAPAPARPYGSTLSTFEGLPGGEFRLFVNDDTVGDTGYINGWTLSMTTRAPAATGFAASTTSVLEGQTARLVVNRTGPANLGPATVNVAITHGASNPADLGSVASTLTFARGEASKTIDIPVLADGQPDEPETFTVALSSATNDALLAPASSSAIVTIVPDNAFTVGQAIRKRNGSARIPVTIPGPGQLTSDDAGPKDLLKTTDAFPRAAGTTLLKLKPERIAKRKLRRGKKVKLTAAITYIPSGGSANSLAAPVALKKKP